MTGPRLKIDWALADRMIKAGEIPWVYRSDDISECLAQVRADPFDRHADMDDILMGYPCPNRSHWRFEAIVDTDYAEFRTGAYCWAHLRKIISGTQELDRIRILVKDWKRTRR